MNLLISRSSIATAILALLVAGCAVTPHGGSLPIDQLPMYGGMDRQAVPELKKADADLITGASQAFGGRAAASRAWVDVGFNFYKGDQLDKAMRRFNQAWLLDPNNPGVYWGFGAVLHDRGQAFAGYDMLKRAYDLGFRDPEFLADLGKMALVRIVERNDLSPEQQAAFKHESEGYFEQAIRSGKSLGYIYGVWASARYWQQDYAGAWEKIALARQNGGDIPPGFLQMLASRMPEPE